MASLVIDGARYEFPTIDTFTMGEARVIKRYTGLSLNELQPDKKTRKPGVDPSDPDFIAALLHIAFARSDPDASSDELEKRVDAVRFARIEAVEESAGS